MPSTVNLSGVRGDTFERVIPLYTGTPQRVLTASEIAHFRSVFPVIRMQVRKQSSPFQLIFELTAEAGELSLTDDSGLWLRCEGTKATPKGEYIYDIEFSGSSTGPYTLIGGTFTLSPDVTV